ncbi:hypothetical protein TL16_g05892 [Triparma laevis f. inornata]|uniref:Tail specific protease domain-containing protein n=1 Tax=Triparma laevis f. inornata TaxID=1714386 RepID=A0A9W7AGG4_9STRA|nr:hypothetical protein TL16_g05892 [Triparma laevis f. inornata]
MKSTITTLLLLSPLVSQMAQGACTLTCPEDTVCYSASISDAADCWNNIPTNVEWKNNTLNTISQSLENFGFGALYHNTGPPYNLKVPVMEELEATKAMVFDNDFQFQEHLQGILTSLLDAHTRYSKPQCYSATLVMPMAFDFKLTETVTNSGAVQSEPIPYFIPSTYYNQYDEQFGGIDAALFSQPVALINGVEVITAIDSWGSGHETRSNNAGARFNAALRSFLYRSVVSCLVDDAGDGLTITMQDGTEIVLDWLVSFTSQFGQASECVTSDVKVESGVKEMQPNRQRVLLNEGLGEAKITHAELHEDRPDRKVVISPEEAQYEISCFVQQTKGDAGADAAEVSEVLVMKVASFSPNSTGYLAAWTGFTEDTSRCLDESFDMIVVDVMQNGGGYVCMGLRLLEMLIEDYWNDHTKVEMKYDLPHSTLMDGWIANVNNPDPYIDPDAVEQILNPETQEPFVDGKAYYYPRRNVTIGGVESWRTNWFCLNCKEAEVLPTGWTPKKFVTPDKLIILSDGTCGSTCASFTRIAQEGNKATFIGAGGLWHQEMDVASFAGGFVCQPLYLATMAAQAGLAAFPNFITNQHWQFGWAAWYSQITPSRPVQFIEQEPAHRTGFWSFPHTSVNVSITTSATSTLYDTVIADSISRIAVESEARVCSNSDGVYIGLVSTLSVALVGLIALVVYDRHKRKQEEGGDSAYAALGK